MPSLLDFTGTVDEKSCRPVRKVSIFHNHHDLGRKNCFKLKFMQSRCEASLLRLETPEQHGPVLPHGERGGEKLHNLKTRFSLTPGLVAFFTPGLVAGGERWGPLSSLLRHLLRIRSTPQATRKKPHLWGESFFQWSIHLVWFGSGNLFLSQSLTCTREDVAEDFLVYAKEQTIRQYKWQHFLKPIDDNRCKRCKM